MADGTVYAGRSPSSERFKWFPDGRSSTPFAKTGNHMYIAPEDAPKEMTWKEAYQYAHDCDASGYYDWRLPTVQELKSIFEHEAAIGGFNNTDQPYYWAKEAERMPGHAACVDFRDGHQTKMPGHFTNSVRLIRGKISFADSGNPRIKPRNHGAPIKWCTGFEIPRCKIHG